MDMLIVDVLLKHLQICGLIFTALHGMQTRSSDENFVRLFVFQTRALCMTLVGWLVGCVRFNVPLDTF